tara:strand:- start:296 stop:763 length:468 start_codon:yes stop_codon:yes gene_type:complete
MIITCPNCNKQFKIDSSLIPNEGRDLQCSACQQVWFYKIQQENDAILKLNDEISNKEEKLEEEKQQFKKTNTKVNNVKENILQKQKNYTLSKNKASNGIKFFSYLIVFIISFIALIILLDTLKTPLTSVIPELEIILLSLFETLQDIKVFIIDLI